ncbi:MAG: hypothetical protein R3C28_11655 [Pirellulaceae bacterium]
MTSYRFEIVLEQLVELDGLLVGEVFRTFQKKPSRPLQDWFVAIGFELLHFGRADIVDRFADVLHDVKPVKDMDGVTGLLANHFDTPAPHVTVVQFGRSFFAQKSKKAKERFGGSLGTDPKQTLLVLIQLIHNGLVAMSFSHWTSSMPIDSI